MDKLKEMPAGWKDWRLEEMRNTASQKENYVAMATPVQGRVKVRLLSLYTYCKSIGTCGTIHFYEPWLETFFPTIYAVQRNFLRN